MIKKKVGPLQRRNFFPEDLDLLYKYFKAKSKKRQSYIREKACNIFEMLKLMANNEKSSCRFL